jgi:hypothetical protein
MSKDFENNDLNKEPNSFGLPDDYFQKSAGDIFNKIEWIEGHKEFKHLSNLKKESGFIIPDAYFDKSEAKLELISYPNLFKAGKNSGFDVPLNYFEDTEVNELSKVFLNEEDELLHVTFLGATEKQNVFTVKENYFVESEQKIISTLSNHAKVINLFVPRIWFSAAAAVFAIVLGLWIYNQYFKPYSDKDCGSIACLDKKDLVKSKNLENLDNDELYELVNTKKLEEKLEKKSDTKTQKTNKDSSLKNVSTDDLLDEI